jgi:tripartite-type tricarboxylate transporter receptor subunit TctC
MENFAAWSALAGPPGLPKDVVERWTDVMAKLSKDAEWLAGIDRLGGIPAVRSPADTERFVGDQFQIYRTLSPRLGTRE